MNRIPEVQASLVVCYNVFWTRRIYASPLVVLLIHRIDRSHVVYTHYAHWRVSCSEMLFAFTSWWSVSVTYTARILCGGGSMKLSGVCPSLCLSHHSANARRCGGFAAVRPAVRRYRSIAARPALSSKCEQCHVVSWRRTLTAFVNPSVCVSHCYYYYYYYYY